MSRCGLFFENSEEMLNFLMGLGVVDKEEKPEELEETPEQTEKEPEISVDSSRMAGGDTASAQAEAENSIQVPCKLSVSVGISEDNPVANAVAAAIKDIYGENTDIKFSETPPPSIYYDEQRKLYYFNGELYGEGAIIWIDIPRGLHLYTNYEFDPDDKSNPQIEPFDTTKFDRYNPRLQLENSYQEVFKLAQSKKNPGYAMICRYGKFFIPCTGFYDENNDKTEYLINLFNIKSCDANSKDRWTMLFVQVGNISDALAFKYAHGTEIDWVAAVEHLLNEANMSEYELPTVKLFDDFEDSMVKREPIVTPPPKVEDSATRSKKSGAKPHAKPKDSKKSQ